jgi:hypothetical protein
MIELTGFTKHGGPLTKRISLAADGSLCSDGSQCQMAAGSAQRVRLPDLDAFARLIGHLPPEEAIGLGALRGDLPEMAEITTKAKIEALNGSNTELIARTGEYIVYHRGAPAVALLDFDSKSMPTEVAARIKALGGFWSAVTSVLPDLKNVGRVARKSTGAGLSRSDTGEQLPGSDGEHLYILVVDGADIERFLRALHDRCWLAGFAWLELEQAASCWIAACRPHGGCARALGIRGQPSSRSTAGAGCGVPSPPRDRGGRTRHVGRMPAAHCR